MTEALAIREADALSAWSPKQVVAQVLLVQQVMKEVMREGEHFGVIPGTKKPSLLKPGAEKLGLTFRLAPEFDIKLTDLGNGQREYAIVCTLRSIQSGTVVGSGVGTCSTMESKYRYRESQRKCPACQAEAIIKGKEEWGGGWLCYKKKGGCGLKFPDGDQTIEAQVTGRTENPDIADTYNTVLKMAKKRAHVDAILTATAASDIFTQDVEDTTKPESPAGTAPPSEPPSHVGSDEGGGPKSPAGDASPPDAHAHAVEDWRLELAGADSVEKLAAVWKTLQKREVWVHFAGPEQVALTMAKDRRKGELQPPTKGALA